MKYLKTFEQFLGEKDQNALNERRTNPKESLKDIFDKIGYDVMKIETIEEDNKIFYQLTVDFDGDVQKVKLHVGKDGNITWKSYAGDQALGNIKDPDDVVDTIEDLFS